MESMAAARLRVQSVVGGPRPQAVINGRMLTVGDRIEGFELVSVERRSVVLSYEGVVIRLGM
ncbi:MAG: general secretion pathway protein GspB [Phycisphaeraceae bacterium]